MKRISQYMNYVPSLLIKKLLDVEEPEKRQEPPHLQPMNTVIMFADIRYVVSLI